MKLETELNSGFKSALKSISQKALDDVIESKQYAARLPIHTSNMQVETEQDSEIIPVIIPPINIYIDPAGYMDDKIAQRYIAYRVAYNNKSFPISHVFSDSGYLCLGTIFVPELIDYHSPQQPLETLFLANDRNYDHGHPNIPMTKYRMRKVQKLLNVKFIKLPDKLIKLMSQNYNWAKHDILWRITNEILKQETDKRVAFTISDELFRIIFMEEK